MKKGLIAVIVIIVLVLIVVLPLISGYNGMVTSRENVASSLAQIQSQLQRRVDLIPNLVETVKGYAAHEEEIMNHVADARAALSGATTPAAMADADANLNDALSRLLVVVENYPALQANQTFIGLMDELAGTENRIAVARNNYNSAAQSYNTMLVRFPSNLIAAMFSFERAEYYQASEAAQTAPSVDFGS